jgi:site-specific recombinase XerD
MLQLFLRHLSKKGKSPNTIRQYESNLTKFFREYPEDPSKITMTMVDSIRKKYSRSTVHAYLSCMRSYLLFAQSEGKKTIDIDKIYLPGIAPTKIVALTKDQIDDMIENAQDLSTRALIAFLFSTGLRISEALHLKRTDLKPEMQII